MTYQKRKQPKSNAVWLTGIIFCGVIFAAGCHRTYVTDDEVNRRIKAEIPTGSTYSQVTDFLQKHHWGGACEMVEFKDWGGTLEQMLSEEEKRSIKWYSTGGIRQAEKTVLKAKGIYMGFFYDKEGKLVTYKLHSYRYWL